MNSADKIQRSLLQEVIDGTGNDDCAVAIAWAVRDLSASAPHEIDGLLGVEVSLLTADTCNVYPHGTLTL